MKLVLGMEVGHSPGDFVLDGEPVPTLPDKGAELPQIFGPCLLWPNGWMDQDGTLIGAEVGLGPGHIVLDGNPAPLPKKRGRAPILGPFYYG